MCIFVHWLMRVIKGRLLGVLEGEAAFQELWLSQTSLGVKPVLCLDMTNPLKERL